MIRRFSIISILNFINPYYFRSGHLCILGEGIYWIISGISGRYINIRLPLTFKNTDQILPRFLQVLHSILYAIHATIQSMPIWAVIQILFWVRDLNFWVLMPI